MDAVQVWPGAAFPLGTTLDDGGANVAVFSSVATRVELCCFDEAGVEERVDLPEHRGPIWHGYVPGLGVGTRYGFRVHGNGDRPHRCDPAKLLVDPYARRISGDVRYESGLFRPGVDSAPWVPRSVAVRSEPAGDEPPRPNRPWHETVLYEAHVRGMTIRHPGVPPELRGTYLGLAHPEVVDHLVRLGVTAVELMPVHAFVSEPALVARGLRNYWGYNTLGYFAPHEAYALADPVAEFRSMVRELHRAGIEVILDVVYNHTAEGSPEGPTLSFRGFDDAAYYRRDPAHPDRYVDYTGCGNSLNARDPHVLQLLMDSLRYWVVEMGVDGFRFDLAAALARGLHEVDRLSAFFDLIQQDPVVSAVKLIAEPWDLGAGGYQVGNFPFLWSEWNGRYRDAVRTVWAGRAAGMAEFAERVSGSADLYADDGRHPSASINFVTCHDGFTLADLVTYEQKRNHANGESNHDGNNDNRGWNCGVEGPSDAPEVVALRARQRRNLLLTLLTSQGVPMLSGGDEIGRTQQGMNNAYAQDNELSWLDWEHADEEFLAFVRGVVAFRSAHPVLRRRRFLQGRPTGRADADDVRWYRADGTPMTSSTWQEPDRRVLCWRLDGDAIAEPDAAGNHVSDRSLFFAVNSGTTEVSVVVPPGSWVLEIDTWTGSTSGTAAVRGGDRVHLGPHSMCVLVDPPGERRRIPRD